MDAYVPNCDLESWFGVFQCGVVMTWFSRVMSTRGCTALHGPRVIDVRGEY